MNESLKVLLSSRYVRDLATLVVAYGISINLVEVTWKSKLKAQVKGKAAIDVVCNPLGKSGGALIQQFMILSFGSLANSTPYLGGILLVIVLAWLGAARSLDSQFSPLAKQELEKEKMLKGKVKEPPTEATKDDNDGSKGNGSVHESVSSEYASNGSPSKQELAPESGGSSETSSSEQSSPVR
ncbi:hypothetical protein B296_00005080 [Ensete ventricosum]|uniref:ADP,ATP carrier protein n=1 Tax=Ensete ventricosum TaxID=4639 RepID=A0A427AI88_ENSVE|nr:hypothetical protein B296_00005080 [Ensete ventricosum]